MHRFNHILAVALSLGLSVPLIIFSPRTTIAMLDEKVVVVTEKDKDKLIKVRKGQTLVVKLTCQPGTGYSWKVAKSCTDQLGSDLRLMSPVYVSDIPSAGRSLIIVAAVKDGLHLRIFDRDGRMAVDADETNLTSQAGPIAALRKHLESLWPPHELTERDKARVIAAVISIVGHAHLLELEGQPTLEADNENEKDGAEENQIFRFKAHTEGQIQLRFEYKRPFGEEKAARTYNVEVKISER
jgi:predicted secreted protein